MINRMDIDALLIGALYGELTPVEEARLTAHLESHPADRTVLADLRQTRVAVHESRILTVQFEPPQSVSALLLQEAARRAPTPARAVVSWFHRFTRSFLMHPAMAAAAMLVLVVGVAGTVYVRRGDQFAEMAAPAATARQVPSQASVQPQAPEMPASEPAGTGRADDGQDDKDTEATGGATGRSSSLAGSSTYRVGIDEPGPQPARAMQPMQNDRQPLAGRAKDTKDLTVDTSGNKANEAARGQVQERPLDPPEVAAPMPKLAKKGNIGQGIELRSPEMAPKDFFDDETGRKGRKNEKETGVAMRDLGNVDTRGDRVGAITADAVEQAPGAATAGGGGATVAPGMMPPRNFAATPNPAAEPAPVATNSASSRAKEKAPAKPVARSSLAQGVVPSSQPSQPSQPSPQPTAVAAAPSDLSRDERRLADKAPTMPAGATLAEEKTAGNKALIDWAQKQRDQVLAFVKSNNCRAAASAAVAIYNRAPDYYAANIATDRSIKPCIAYVNNERERVDRSRAAMKRANAAEPPAAAPPSTRK
jgi:hypothetical protein